MSLARPHREWVSVRFLVVTACLTATLLGAALGDSRKPDSLREPLEKIDREIFGWRMTNQDVLEPNVLARLLPSSYLSRVYQKDQHRLGLFVAYYAQQQAGESIHSPKVCLPGNGWEIVRQGSTDLRVGGERITVNQYQIENAGDHMVALYWYQSRGRIVASEYLGKILLIKDAVTSGHASGSIVRITTNDDSWSTREAATFAGALIPQLRRLFGD